MKIPHHWTFKNADVAKGFDSHVREQLPWYDLATDAVRNIGRHFIPPSGLVYDIGASTGNIGRALAETLLERKANLIAIEESREMASMYSGPGQVQIENAVTFKYQEFDFAVCFLVLMFIPISHRASLIRRLTGLVKPGGAMVIIDKINPADGYLGTVLRRMTMELKVRNGTNLEDVMRKELSLSGTQRPINPRILGPKAHQFFQVGEFAGWVIENEE